MADTIKDLLELELQDAYSAEQQALEVMPDLVSAITSPALKAAFGKHLTESEAQVRRLEQVCEMLEVEPDGEGCEAMEGLIEEAEDLLDDMDEGPVMDAAVIIAMQKIEHHEIAIYGTLTTLLKAMGHAEAAALLGQSLDEEKKADELLTHIAETEVNAAAISASDEEDEDEDDAA